MLRTFAAALLLTSGLAITASPARALHVFVTQVDRNTDWSMTYHFAVKTDEGETLTPGEPKETSDFVTVYNFYGLVDGSAKSPTGWEFSSEQFGRTPTLNGYPWHSSPECAPRRAASSPLIAFLTHLRLGS
jgi:hypothetical protein